MVVAAKDDKVLVEAAEALVALRGGADWPTARQEEGIPDIKETIAIASGDGGEGVESRHFGRRNRVRRDQGRSAVCKWAQCRDDVRSGQVREDGSVGLREPVQCR